MFFSFPPEKPQMNAGRWYEINASPETEVDNFDHHIKCTECYDTLPPLLFASVSQLTSRFLLTMAASGFSPFHRLWPNDAPAECAGITPTPWAMMYARLCVI